MSSENNCDRGRSSALDQPSPTLTQPPGDVLDRQHRLADFQAAWRTFTSSLAEVDANRGRALARELHERLETLDDQFRSSQARPHNTESSDREAEVIRDGLERLDGELERYAELLCNKLDGVPQMRLCALLPADDVAQNNGFAALIDFILVAQPDLDRYGALLELLVTMLSTGEQGGRRRVVRDPATLTATLRAHSERAAANSDLDFGGIEQEFVEAAQDLEAGLADRPFRDMRARKTELGCGVLVPQILRSVVFHNVTTWNSSQSVEASSGSNEAASDRANTDASAAPAQENKEGIASEDAARRDPESESDHATNETDPRSLADGTPDTSEVQWRLDPIPIRTPSEATPEPIANPQRTRARHGVMAASLAVALLLATQPWWPGSGDTVRILPEFDLHAISTQLDSGYRDDFGSGPLFIGTVGAEWEQLSSVERERNAREIVARLGESGVREILVYDARQRTALHYAEGLPLKIGL